MAVILCVYGMCGGRGVVGLWQVGCQSSMYTLKVSGFLSCILDIIISFLAVNLVFPNAQRPVMTIAEFINSNIT